MIFTTLEDKRIQQKYKQKSLRFKWKLNTNSIFNLKSFVTVALSESKSTETKTSPGQQNSVYMQSVTIWIKLQVQLSAV